MANYNVSITQSIEVQPANISASQETTFTIANPLSASSYFTLETARNNNGFYDSTSPKNTSGSFSLGTGLLNIIQSDYITSVIVAPGGGTLTFTPANDITGSTLYLRGIGSNEGKVFPPIPPIPPIPPPVYPAELKLYLDGSILDSNPGSGTTWFDLTTNNTDGQLLNGSTFSNDAVTFDGIDDYVSLNGLQSYSSAEAHTYVAWVNCSNPNFNYMWVLNNGDSGAGSSILLLRNGDTGFQHNILLFFGQGGNLAYSAGVNSVLMNINEWYHISTVYENNTVKFFVDGVLTGQANTGNWNAGNSTPAIGRWFNGSFPFRGQIGYTKVYSSALTNSEVTTDFNNTKANYGK
jgi:hypothetical protein